MRCVLLLSLVSLLACQYARAVELTYTIKGGKHDRVNVPVRLPINDKVNDAVAGTTPLITPSGDSLNCTAAQITQPPLLARDSGKADNRKREITFVMREQKAGENLEVTVNFVKQRPNKDAFEWTDIDEKAKELTHGDRPVLRYMHERLDKSSPERVGETYKVYHHVYDPLGKRYVTKGPGGKFPHHRGLFYGFNRISYGNQQADVWHCRSGESQAHQSIASVEAGTTMGRHTLQIAWNGQDEKPFAFEERELTAYNVQGGLLIEFASRLTTLVGPVKLDGDPQHAGFQFRASQEVPDKTANQTYYLRPDGKGEPGEFRNWSSKARQADTKRKHVNLPWNALSFVLGDQRYTCCYIDHPNNPKEARYSERDYGRFGSYFEYELTEDRPLEINYRVWLQEGEMTVEEVDRIRYAFVDSPHVID